MTKEYYSVEQISKLLDIHPKTVQRYIREGKIRASKVGKFWRVSGHDLSVFTENTKNLHMFGIPKKEVKISCVADIDVFDCEEAIRIINALTAALNVKPPEFKNSTMYTQYLEFEHKVRITLWGNIAFMTAMMQCIETLAYNMNQE